MKLFITALIVLVVTGAPEPMGHIVGSEVGVTIGLDR